MKKMPTTGLLVSLLVSAPFMATAEALPLTEISDYLTDLRSATGQFTQVNDDGSISSGKIYIKRPGKVRFEYDEPDSTLVVAGANTVAIFDKKSNQPPQTFPLSRTPLSIILADEVDFGSADMVSEHGYDGTSTTVTTQDPDHPDYGSIQLKFTGDPVALRQWVIRDGSGGSTTVILGDMTVEDEIPNSLFNTHFERSFETR